MLVHTKAIVIHAIRYGEADLIVKCFTQTDGLKSYLLRSILKSKKGKLKASMFQPLSQLELVANHKNKGSLEYIKEAKINYPYQQIHTHIYKSSITIFIAEILKNCIQEEEKNESLFIFLEESFQELDISKEFSNFHLWLLLELTRYLGFYPHNNQGNVFNMIDGTFQNYKDNKYCLESEEVLFVKNNLNKKFSAAQQYKLNQSQRQDILNLLLTYYELHLHGFKKPKSLEVLSQLF
ncbi:DNA repair protein RecO [Mesonia sp. K7]|uniref:DNA repair protein RecO n=1 Tax=Mesonia sp. K7 TaxID=2218606 RepID=UPI000DAA37D4|nr:DNA repair protein RecO [Mesonia sp. K7]PZD79006.1 DNA repair protein RecO [Mesonia sp. K7]